MNLKVKETAGENHLLATCRSLLPGAFAEVYALQVVRLLSRVLPVAQLGDLRESVDIIA